MKKLMLVLIISLFFAGCSSSPYVGTWKTSSGEKLEINDDGSINSSWKDSDGTLIQRGGTWEVDGEGSIVLNGSNAGAKAKIIQNKLVLENQRKARLHFTRQQMR